MIPDALTPLPDEFLCSLRHPIQPRRFALALFFALILFPLIAIGLAAGTLVLIVPFFGFLIWLSGRVFYSNFLGNSILVSELNYPRIHRIGEELRIMIGYTKPVDIFVYEQGSFNASLMKFFFYRRAVFLNSELLEAGVTDDELRWLIGRFVGYLWARKKAGFWGWSIRAAETLLVFNLFLMPYERGLNYTGDRIALAVIGGDVSSAIAAMQKIFVGRQLGYSVNPNGIVDQHRRVKGSIFALLARLASAFPHMTARYVDLIEFAKQRYPAQFERFDAANPGLPPDLPHLIALPNAAAVRPGSSDPVWGSLAAAVFVTAGITLITFLTFKVIVPQLKNQGSAASAANVTPISTASITGPAPSREQPPAAQTAGVAAPSVLPYTSIAGGFSVLFPDTPAEKTDQISLSGGGTAPFFEVTYHGTGYAYLVMYYDDPAVDSAAEPQPVLERLRDAFVQEIKGTLASDEPLNLGSAPDAIPGRASTIVGAKGTAYNLHIFLNGHRVYQVVTVSSSNSSESDPERFLASFKVL